MKITFPSDWPTDDWHGHVRHVFSIEGYTAWVVEPEIPAGDGRWSWVTIWPHAYIKRVGIEELLAHGYYHAHIEVLSTRATPEGVRIMKAFHDQLVSLGLSAKASFIGMSWGGFFALRYCETYPEDAASIYLDAPLCNAALPENDPVFVHNAELAQAIHEQFGMTEQELLTSKLNPINNVEPLVKAGIPMMAEIGMTDMTLSHEQHFDLLEKRILELGGSITVERRNSWGHHPHGVDDPERLLAFHSLARL